MSASAASAASASACLPELGDGAAVLPLRPFCRETRLRARWQFARVRAEGRRFVGELLVFQALLPSPDGLPRLATVISRRYSGRAVERNRARRLCRESWRRLFGAVAPAWIILVPRWRMKDARQQPVQAELERLCRQAGLLPPVKEVLPE